MFRKLKFVILVWCGVISAARGAGKYIEPQKYNEAVVMGHILGSGSLNLVYFFHILGIDCENKDRDYYRFAEEDFRICLNRTELIPLGIRSRPYGSVEKACEMWRYNKGCYDVYKDDLDDCGINSKNSEYKANDAFRFTDAYAKYICRDPEDTELHLIDRFTKRDIIAPGVFTCFPTLQERIVNCIKKDGYTYTSLCSKFYTVRNCFAKYFSEEYCDDDDVIIFMEDMFHSVGINLKCPRNSEEWLSKLDPPTPTPFKPKTTTYGYGYPIKSSTYAYGSSYPTKKTTKFDTYDPYPPKTTTYGYGNGYQTKRPKTTTYNYGSGFPYY